MDFVYIHNTANRYIVSDHGIIYDTKNKSFIKQSKDKDGYCQCGLELKTGRRKTCKVHRVVASSFITGFDHDLQVNHIDGDKTNNNINNLELVNRFENMRHAKEKLGRIFQEGGKKNSNFRGVHVGTHKKSGVQIVLEGKQMMIDMGFKPSCIYDCINGRQKSHKGYTWERVESTPT